MSHYGLDLKPTNKPELKYAGETAPKDGSEFWAIVRIGGVKTVGPMRLRWAKASPGMREYWGAGLDGFESPDMPLAIEFWMERASVESWQESANT